MMSLEEFAKHFDLAYLSPEFQEKDIIEACNIAKKYKLNAVNVNSCWGELVVKELEGSGVGPSAVIGFPYGACTSETKYAELREMVDIGCTALDMVINIGALKGGNWDLVTEEVEKFVEICGKDVHTKLIFEVGFLNEDEIAKLTQIACKAGITYVKTATGSQDFPKLTDVQVMKDNLSGDTMIKVSGVPRTLTMPAVKFLFEEMGVALVGTRSAGRIVEEYKRYYLDK